ncbi:methyltransferase domain-containing protein [Candidatus Woesearchaeota archaeon]|nr:methyltransferase domain-containing protein [Candidatus Woesearchaeota archaeon]
MSRIILRERHSKHDKKPAEFYAPDEAHDFHTDFGTISKADLKKGGVVSIGKETFTIMPPSFIDTYSRLGRGAQVVHPKDIGLVIAETGLGKDSLVLDIGAGSGFSASLFARIAKEVHAYDIDDRNLKKSKENIKELGIKNITITKGDVYDAATIKEKDIDLFFLDVPEPWRALTTAKNVLKSGGFLVAYSPCITQTMQTIEALDSSFLHLRTVEVMLRDWKVQGQAVRPESKDFQHTAFLSFIRKV